jgi:nucleotidyltransferase substrate binding protein (TIGR01987 family)
MLDLSKFESSLFHLEAQFGNYNHLPEREDIAELDIEGIGESVIQRFEVCYDCAWKVLKRYMSETMGLPDLPNSPKPLFRIAAENKIIPSVERWLLYADARVGTAHDYSSDKADAALSVVEDFIGDAKNLYAVLHG